MSQESVKLFERHFAETVLEIKEIRSHGSARRIFRLISEKRSVIAVENDDAAENHAFITFARHFRKFSLPVPEVFVTENGGKAYLQSDLGDDTLFDLLSRQRTKSDPFPKAIESLYIEVLKILPQFQVKAGASIDYNACHKLKDFNREMMLKDMHYFRDQYLVRTGRSFDEAALDKDFLRLADFLAGARSEYFMYRDFQSRNIMVNAHKLYFIDFQGGCRGPLQYDVASLLYQSSARLPEDARARLLDNYLESLKSYVSLDRDEFVRYFYGFVYLRMMQALGTYGLRGLEERKFYFIESIQHGLKNLRELFQAKGLPVEMPEFRRFIESIEKNESKLHKLSVNIYSMSYKKEPAIPFNPHGGGFVFDCRCLPNPGREEKYKYLSGLDQAVIQYLKEKDEVGEFFTSVSKVIDQSIESYLKRGFTELSVTFGCTGGQHRSVFLAEQLGAHLNQRFNIRAKVTHLSKADWLIKG